MAIQENLIEQVKTFKYWGINFYYNRSWVAHHKCALSTARNSAMITSHFFYTRRNNGFKSCQWEIQFPTSSWSPIRISAFDHPSEDLQFLFPWKIRGLSTCAPYVVIHLETDQISLQTQAQPSIFGRVFCSTLTRMPLFYLCWQISMNQTGWNWPPPPKKNQVFRNILRLTLFIFCLSSVSYNQTQAFFTTPDRGS